MIGPRPEKVTDAKHAGLGTVPGSRGMPVLGKAGPAAGFGSLICDLSLVLVPTRGLEDGGAVELRRDLQRYFSLVRLFTLCLWGPLWRMDKLVLWRYLYDFRRKVHDRFWAVISYNGLPRG